MFSPIEEIKSRIDLVEFIQTYLRLQKAGVNFKANCPFHGEKTPSFFVSPSRQIWHCFGCSRGGDAFKFLMEIEGYDFPEALRFLAERAGIELKRENPAIRSERNRLYDICEEAARTFEKNFSITPAVKSYMRSRGVKDDTLLEFRVGFAPRQWDFLLKALAAKGFKTEEIEKAGLVLKGEGGSWHDRFRGRIMFPISDANGRVIGFGGRIFEEGSSFKVQDSNKEAKYINTPNTLIYNKSRVLYGFDKAKHQIRTANRAVVVEGYMDCLMSHQAGVKNAIAVSGTVLTLEQLKTIRRIADTLVSSFDTDSAGESATGRSLRIALDAGFECRIAVIPSGKAGSRISAETGLDSPSGESAEISLPAKDPADAVKENPAEWIKSISEAPSVTEFYFAKAFGKFDPKTAQGKKDIAAMLLPWIANTGNEIEKSHWIRALAERMAVSEDSIWKELGKGKGETREIAGGFSDPIAALPRRRDLLEERLLALLPFAGPEAREQGLSGHLAFVSDTRTRIFALLSADPGQATTPELAKEIEMLRFKGEILLQTLPDAAHEFLLCRQELEKECIREELMRLGYEIGQIEREGGRDAVVPLLQNFRALSEKLKNFS